MHFASASIHVTLIETNSLRDLIDVKDWIPSHAGHYCLPVTDDYLSGALTDFSNQIGHVSSSGRIEIVLVSFRNGHNRPAFLIAGFLIL